MDLKEFSCRDVGIDCDYKVQGETEEELFKNAEEHGRQAHDMKEPLSEKIKDKIRSVIHVVKGEERPMTKTA